MCPWAGLVEVLRMADLHRPRRWRLARAASRRARDSSASRLCGGTRPGRRRCASPRSAELAGADIIDRLGHDPSTLIRSDCGAKDPLVEEIAVEACGRAVDKHRGVALDVGGPPASSSTAGCDARTRTPSGSRRPARCAVRTRRRPRRSGRIRPRRPVDSNGVAPERLDRLVENDVLAVDHRPHLLLAPLARCRPRRPIRRDGPRWPGPEW